MYLGIRLLRRGEGLELSEQVREINTAVLIFWLMSA